MQAKFLFSAYYFSASFIAIVHNRTYFLSALSTHARKCEKRSGNKRKSSESPSASNDSTPANKEHKRSYTIKGSTNGAKRQKRRYTIKGSTANSPKAQNNAQTPLKRPRGRPKGSVNRKAKSCVPVATPSEEEEPSDILIYDELLNSPKHDYNDTAEHSGDIATLRRYGRRKASDGKIQSVSQGKRIGI
jgi:hypothetical protein